MKIYSSLIVLFVTFSFLGSCSRDSGVANTEEATLRNALLDFQSRMDIRKPNEIETHSIWTSKGAFTIANCEPKLDEDGQNSYQSPVRMKGFYVAPRGVWVDTIKEAEDIIIEDYRAGKGAKIKTTTN